MMAAGVPWTDAEDVTLRALHKAGQSLHSIAQEMGRGKRTIGRHSERLGLSWDRARTANAAQAKHIDNKARRAVLEQRLLEETAKVMGQLWEPTLVFSFGGANNEYREHVLEKPTPADQKAIVQTASTALNAANKLHDMNAGGQAQNAKSMLARMQAELLQAVHSEGIDDGGVGQSADQPEASTVDSDGER